WSETDKAYRDQSKVAKLSRGPVNEGDLEAFVMRNLSVRDVPGWTKVTLKDGPDGEPIAMTEAAPVIQLPDGQLGFLSADTGLKLERNDGIRAEAPKRIGLNHPLVAQTCRDLIGGTKIGARGETGLRRGAGVAMLPSESFESILKKLGNVPDLSSGFVFLAYVVRRLDTRGSMVREDSASFEYHIASQDGECIQACPSDTAAEIIRGLRQDRVKMSTPPIPGASKLRDWEKSMIFGLRKIQPGEAQPGVFPIAAIWIEAAPKERGDSSVDLS
ncbi:MAG: hypothetical protein P1V97_13425, partial [Planctomycetota bacterium]|nr:hypothetical protein [Planctomycetota bacterium]